MAKPILRQVLAAACVLSLSASTAAQQIPFRQRPFSEMSLRASGQPIIPLYDGWYANDDGTFSICFGYFNLNTEQSFDVPLGPANVIEPSEFDGVQPTHFDSVPDPTLTEKYRHHWCVFTVRVPADFGDRRIVWTLNTQGEDLSVPGHLVPDYVLDERTSPGRGAVAPVLRLAADGPEGQGRNGLSGEPPDGLRRRAARAHGVGRAPRVRHMARLDEASGACRGNVRRIGSPRQRAERNRNHDR